MNPFQKVCQHSYELNDYANVWTIYERAYYPIGNGFYVYDYEYIDDLEEQWMEKDDEHKRDTKPHKGSHNKPDHVLSCMVCRCV